ncbi:MAG: GNAT family N-acetyltransferase [Pseudomonadota bacterium]
MIKPAQFYAAMDGTWPAAEYRLQGPWTLRDGAGGGRRVSATTTNRQVRPTDIDAAEMAMQDMGQDRLFMLTAGQETLDETLAARGYVVVDPVQLYACPTTNLTDIPIPRVTAFGIWEPLAIMEEIWASGGVGPTRLAVMARAKTKTGIFARAKDKPAGVGFAAIHNGICMVHAVEVLEHQRRQGVAGWIMRRAAFWAAEQGARTLAVLCVKDNEPANKLYQRLGFAPVCDYHYRIKK